jgi:spermidine synthase
VYQLVWVRQLLLVVGTTTGAVSTVLSVFMAGLGIGAWRFGAVADRSRSPLKLYGYLELGIGLYALLLPALLEAATSPYVSLARALGGHAGALALLRVALGFLLLLVPTILMGGTLPVLVRFVSGDPQRFGANLGTLYGANLLGGIAGSLAAGFVLVRELGVHGATMTAVLGNLGIGVAALIVSGRARAAVGPVETAPTAVRLEIPASARPLVWGAVLMSGVLSMAYEVLWTRILVFVFGSTVYSFTVILATVLTGLALGSRVFVAIERRANPLSSLGAALVLGGLTALWLAPLSTQAPEVIRGVLLRFGASEATFLAGTAFSAALVILLPATLMGVVLPLGMRLLVDDLVRAGRRVGAAYLVNSLGCVTGSLLAGFALIPLLGLKGALVFLVATQVALGGALASRAAASGRQRLALAAAAALLVAGFALVTERLRGLSPFDPIPADAGRPAPVVVAHRDGVAASTSVVDYPGQGRSLRIDGFEAATDRLTSGSGYMALMTHIPMLLHPAPRDLLVLCFGTGSTAGAGLLHPGASVTVVDINPTVFDLAPYFADVNHRVDSNPRAQLVVDDGRNFLLTTRASFDVITSEPMPPRFAGVVNLYSREYYLLARERLRPGGFVVQWLPMHLVDFGDALGILRTVQDVFPETSLWLHGNTGIIVARHQAEVVVDLGRVARAFENDALRLDLRRLGVADGAAFARLYALGPEAVRAATRRVPAITDDLPWLEFHRVRSPLLPTRGPFNFEHARAMELVYRLRAEDDAPLRGVTAEEAARMAAARRAESHVALGHIHGYWGLGRPASVEYEAAARADAITRPALLLRAAQARLQEGDRDLALRLARESLALSPSDDATRAFLATLEPSAR